MTLPRRRVPELMDRVDADPAELARSLDDLRRVNRWLGGTKGAIHLVMDLIRRIPDHSTRVLDVGTGGADIPLALAQRARADGRPIRITGLDPHPITVAVARLATAGNPDIDVVAGDGLALPFANGAFDIVMSHTTLHHFDAAEAERMIREMDRVARWAVVVTDLARSRRALAGARLLALTVWRDHPITRHDGPHSVRAAFTPAEIAALASRAVSSPFQVCRQPVFRLSLVVDRLAKRETGRAYSRARE